MSQTRDDQVAQRETALDLQAAIQARRELDPALEDHLVEAFLARIEERVDQRVIQQVGQQPAARPAARDEKVQIEVIAGSFLLAIPSIAIAGDVAGTIGIMLVVFAVVAVNLLYFIDRWVRFN